MGGDAGKGAAAGAAVGAMAGDFGAEKSAGSKLLHNNRNKLKRRPPFRPGISARWPRVCRGAATPSTDEQLVEIFSFAVIQAKRLPKS